MRRGRRQAIGKGASLFQARGYVRHVPAILSAKAVSRAGERVAGPLPGGDKLVTRLPLRPAGPRFRQGSEPRPSSGRRQREEPHPSSGRDVHEVAPEALARLRGYSWPGNVRELQSVLKQALLRAHGPVLLPDFLPELAEAPPREGFDPEAFLIRPQLGPDARDLYAETHRELDRLLLPRVLDYTGGNQHRAALLLGIARKTLRTKLRELGLRVAHSVEADEDDLP